MTAALSRKDVVGELVEERRVSEVLHSLEQDLKDLSQQIAVKERFEKLGQRATRAENKIEELKHSMLESARRLANIEKEWEGLLTVLLRKVQNEYRLERDLHNYVEMLYVKTVQLEGVLTEKQAGLTKGDMKSLKTVIESMLKILGRIHKEVRNIIYKKTPYK